MTPAPAVSALPPADVLRRALALLGEAVAGRAGAIALLFAEPTLVIGSAQPLETIDELRAAADGVTVLRRGSGGGAVLCDRGLLEVDVALPDGHPLLVADVSESYRFLGEWWQQALEGLGIESRLVSVAEARAISPERRVAARAACYAGISPFEVLASDGRKLVGLCQRRRRGAALFQCSIACGDPPSRVADYVAVDPALLARSASLDQVGLDASPAAVWDALDRCRPDGVPSG